jgi:hypothetical protein
MPFGEANLGWSCQPRLRQPAKEQGRGAAWPLGLLRIGLRLRRESRMTPGRITQRPQMGTKPYRSPLLCWQGRQRRKKR